MITKPWCLRWMALVLGLLLCTGRATARTPTSHDGPATLELKRLVAANPEVKRLLIASIERRGRSTLTGSLIPRSPLSSTTTSFHGPNEPSRGACSRRGRMRPCTSASIRASATFTSLSINR